MIRVPFSVYSGWVTCATVLNSVYMLMSWGAVDRMKMSVAKNNGNGWWSWLSPIMGVLNENTWSIVILWCVEIFFEVLSWWMRNPIWGSVFTWAGAAILNNQIDRSAIPKQYPQDDDGTDVALLANTGAVVMLHGFSMALLFVYLVIEALQPWYEPIPFWDHGVFGMTDWSLMFTQIKQLLSYPEEYLQTVGATREAVIEDWEPLVDFP